MTTPQLDTELVSYPPLPVALTAAAAESLSSPLDSARASSPHITASSAVVSSPPQPPPPSSESAPATVGVTVLVMSGARKTFRFDGEITVGRMKELIWSMWPPEWNTDPVQPPSPAYFRILYRGRMLDDESTLNSNQIPALPAPRATIVHLSVRTIPLGASEDVDKTDSASPRPPLGARASSRISRLVGQSPPGAAAVVTNGASARANEAARRAGQGTDGHGSGGSGCGCVIA